MQSVEEINRSLSGYTDVVELMLSSSTPPDWKASLKLVLRANRAANRAVETLTVIFEGVSSLQLRDFGNLSQIMLLKVEDVRRDQLDQIKFLVTDLENQRIAFACGSIRFPQ